MFRGGVFAFNNADNDIMSPRLGIFFAYVFSLALVKYGKIIVKGFKSCVFPKVVRMFPGRITQFFKIGRPKGIGKEQA